MVLINDKFKKEKCGSNYIYICKELLTNECSFYELLESFKCLDLNSSETYLDVELVSTKIILFDLYSAQQFSLIDDNIKFSSNINTLLNRLDCSINIYAKLEYKLNGEVLQKDDLIYSRISILELKKLLLIYKNKMEKNDSLDRDVIVFNNKLEIHLEVNNINKRNLLEYFNDINLENSISYIHDISVTFGSIYELETSDIPYYGMRALINGQLLNMAYIGSSKYKIDGEDFEKLVLVDPFGKEYDESMVESITVYTKLGDFKVYLIKNFK